MGRHKLGKPRRSTPPASGVSTTGFVIEQAEWLGYITGQAQPTGYATHGETFEQAMGALTAVAYHSEDAYGVWSVVLHTFDGHPGYAQPTDEPVTSLHTSVTVAAILADEVLPDGSVVLHSIDGNPFQFVDVYRERHPDGKPVISRAWSGIIDVPADLPR